MNFSVFERWKVHMLTVGLMSIKDVAIIESRVSQTPRIPQNNNNNKKKKKEHCLKSIQARWFKIFFFQNWKWLV